MAKILRVIETLTDHKRLQWHMEANNLREQGLNPPEQEPKEYPIELSYGAICALLYNTYGESIVRNSVAVLISRGYLKRYQSAKNSIPVYVLNIDVLQAALKKQAEQQLSGVEIDRQKSQVSKSTARRPKSTPSPSKSTARRPKSTGGSVDFDTNNNKNSKTTNKNEKTLSSSLDAPDDAVAPSPNKNELSPEEKTRARALKALIEGHCGKLAAAGPNINENKVIARLVRKYTDGDLFDINHYLIHCHFKWSKPDFKFKVRAKTIEDEAESVLRLFAEQPELRTADAPPQRNATERDGVTHLFPSNISHRMAANMARSSFDDPNFGQEQLAQEFYTSGKAVSHATAF
jgi:hypothetical protein